MDSRFRGNDVTGATAVIPVKTIRGGEPARGRGRNFEDIGALGLSIHVIPAKAGIHRSASPWRSIGWRRGELTPRVVVPNFSVIEYSSVRAETVVSAAGSGRGLLRVRLRTGPSRVTSATECPIGPGE